MKQVATKPHIQLNKSKIAKQVAKNESNRKRPHSPLLLEEQYSDPKKSKRKSMIPKIKNDNPEWHSLNKEMTCQICVDYMGVSLVTHYVNDHQNSEVFPSRVAPSVGDFLRNVKGIHNCKIEKPVGIRCSSKYIQFCYFCNESMGLTKSNWIYHMERHAGYYRYQCNNCSKKFPQKSQHMCEDEYSIKKMSNHQFEGINVIGYVCDLCNYVRFGKKEMENHLRNEHNGAGLEKFKEVVFLTFEETEEKSDVVTLKESNEEEIVEASKSKLKIKNKLLQSACTIK